MNYVTMLGSRVPPSDHNVLQFTDGLLFNTYIFFLKLTNFVKKCDSDCNQQVADYFQVNTHYDRFIDTIFRSL